MSEAAILIDPSQNTTTRRRSPGCHPDVPTDQIRAAILGLYLERQADGGTTPTMVELHEACGSKSRRVSEIHAEMRAAGDLPALPLSRHQAGGMAPRKKMGPTRPRPTEPLARKPIRDDHPSWSVVVYHMRKERWLRRLAAKATEYLSRREAS